MNWQKKIYENICEHQFKRGGPPVGRSPRQQSTEKLKQTALSNISSEHALVKSGKDTSALRKRIRGYLKELEATRGLTTNQSLSTDR